MFREKIDAKVADRVALLTTGELKCGSAVKPPKNWNSERTLRQLVEIATTIEECTSKSTRGLFSLRSVQVKAIMDNAGGFLGRVTAVKDGVAYVAFQRESSPLVALVCMLHRFRAETLDWRVDTPFSGHTNSDTTPEAMEW